LDGENHSSRPLEPMSKWEDTLCFLGYLMTLSRLHMLCVEWGMTASNEVWSIWKAVDVFLWPIL